MKEKTTAYITLLGIYLRGFCMGAADLIPGVSGGTIAFISGIYHRLLSALGSFSIITFWRALKRLDFRTIIKETDAIFLLTLFVGLFTAVITLSGVLHYLLENKAHLLLGFFFGLVIASIVIVGRKLTGVSLMDLIAGIIAAILTFLIVTTLQLQDISPNPLMLFFGGMIAICAMLLPGISGSYILLILGLYPIVIEAIHDRHILTLIVFAAGCGSGLLFFSRLLAEILRRFYTRTMIILVGIMTGALPKIWPWKEGDNNIKIILQDNILPNNYSSSPDIPIVIALAVIGMVAVLTIDWLSSRHQKN